MQHADIQRLHHDLHLTNLTCKQLYIESTVIEINVYPSRKADDWDTEKQTDFILKFSVGTTGNWFF